MYDNDVINSIYVDGNNNNIDSNMYAESNMNSMNNSVYKSHTMGAPITEGMKENCVHRTILHDVPHVCPVHTRIINHHVYRHFYQPRYTCSEENTVSNIQCGSCCN